MYDAAEVPPDAAAPYPPLSLAERVCCLDGRDDPYGAYDRAGAEHRDALLRLLPEDWSLDGRRVLDFGCGAGRTLRQFLPEAESGELWGADIDRPSIEWMQGALCPPLNALVAPVAPPLPLDAESFDLVWALSVFTHLTDTSLPWLCELHRILKPRALLVASYMGRWNSHRRLFPGGWDEDLVGMNVLEHDQDWEAGGPSVFMSDWWVQAHWGRAFEILDTAPVHGQTWALLRKRDVTISVADLEKPADDPREVRALRHNVVQAVMFERFARAVLQRHYERSLSWRVTRPLRAAGRYLRALRR